MSSAEAVAQPAETGAMAPDESQAIKLLGFDSLSDELIVYILSFCEPQDLNRLSHVSRRFSSICHDDSVWRAAFETRFGHSELPLACRLDQRSWRKEYLKRIKLTRTLRSQRLARMKIEPCIDTINEIFIEPGDAHNAIVGSQASGFLRRCSVTGKLSRDHMSCSATQDPRPVSALTFSSRRAVCGGVDGVVSHFLLQQDVPQRHRTFEASHARAVSCARVVNDSAVTGGDDGNVILWSLLNHELVHRMVHGSDITAVALAPGNGVVSVAADGSLCLWDWKTGECRLRNEQANARIVALEIDEECKWAVMGCMDGAVLLCDLTTNRAFELHKHSGPVTCLAVDWAGQCAVSGSEDTTLRVSALPADSASVSNSFKPRTLTLSGHLKPITHVCADGVKIVSASEGKDVKIWDRLSGEMLREIYTTQSRGVHNRITALAMSGSHFVFAVDNVVRVISLVSTPAPDSKVVTVQQQKQLAKRRSRERRLSVQEVEEELEWIHEERAETAEWQQRAQQHNLRGMSEQEMLEYALALSISQDAVAADNSALISQGDYVDADEEAQLAWALRESTMLAAHDRG